MAFVQSTAGRVSYQERGSGPPVVLLHATLHDLTDFDAITGPLAARGYRTVAVDWPGHGQSAIPGSRLRTFYTGHVVFAADPAGFLGAVLPFLSSATSAAG